MDNNRWLAVAILLVLGLLVGYTTRAAMGTSIKVGLISELTGDIPAVGQSSKNGAQLAVKQINDAGGVIVAGKRHKIVLVTKDNGGNVDQTTKVTNELIKNNKVAAIVGPNASRYAIPAATVAEREQTVLISPWSTNPTTTLDDSGTPKHYVFRAAYTDPFQGRVLARFAMDGLKKTKAAVLADSSADVLVGQADYFKDTFTAAGGEIVSDQRFKAGDSSVSEQLEAIKKENPEIVFLPAYYNDAASIIKQAKAMKLDTIFLGSDAWGSGELLKSCGQDCNGAYLSAHYSPDSTSAATKKFVSDYQAAYNATPDDVAALNYDSIKLLVRAIQNAGSIDNREAIRDSLAGIRNFAGVTGKMTFDGQSGDPIKGAVILEVQDGKLVWHADAKP